MKWLKFDLHQHTKNEILYDRREYKSNYTHEKFFDLIKEQDIALKAVTNHNIINVVEHIKYSLICEKAGVNYLPGVEVDYLFDNERFQAISILNPIFDIVSYSNKLKKIVDKKELVALNKEDFANLHENYEYIFIPHYAKIRGIKPNKDALLEEEQNWVVNMIQSGHSIPVIFENTQEHHKYIVYGMLNEKLGNKDDYAPCYVGTDYKFDNDISRKDKSKNRLIYMMNAEPTYRGLEISIRNYKQRISSEFQTIQRNNYIKKIAFSKNINFEITQDIELSPSLNVIVGSSGSGKTLLLNEIFHNLTGNSLTDVTDKKDPKDKNRPYLNRIESENWIKIYKKDNSKNLRVIEIPSLYKTIIKNVDSPNVLGEIFGIDSLDQANLILKQFKEDVITCERRLNICETSKSSGQSDVESIIEGIKYLNENSRKEDFVLSQKPEDNKVLTKIKNDLNSIANLKADKINFEKHIKDITTMIGTETSKKLSKTILDNYSKLQNELILKEIKILKLKNKEEINEKIYNVINKSIENQLTNLGERTKTVTAKRTIVNSKIINLINNIKNYIKYSYKIESSLIEYPLQKIKESLQINNSNEFARYEFSIEDKCVENVMLDNNPLIDNTNKLTVFRRLFKNHEKFNFTKKQDLINLVKVLNKENIKLSEILKDEIPIKTQLIVNGTWRDTKEINPGDISKISMNFYFKNIINEEQPDVIFIDQPENDLDKDFITNILSEFIKDKKLQHQIIITSHDPILTVNSDVNTIIEANISKENKIVYKAYKIEDLTKGQPVTDNVAKILDGSIKNIMDRYNTYGGIKKYE